MSADATGVPLTAGGIEARLDRLPPSPAIWGPVARLSAGAFFEIYETALTSLLAAALIGAGVFRKDGLGLFGVPDLATFAFATFSGLFAGAVVFSSLSDRLGRQPIFIWSVVWYAAVTLVMAFQSDPVVLSILRFVSAVGVGANIVALDAYLAEILPRSMRGRGFAISKAIQYSAVPVAGILSAILAHRSLLGIAGWRYLLIVPVFGAALVLWLRRRLPESPRWLAHHGRLREADALLTALEEDCRRRGLALPAPLIMPAAPRFAGRYRELLRSPLLGPFLTVTIAGCAGSISYFGFNNWLPSLLIARDVAVTKSLVYTTLVGLSFPLAPLVFIFFADRFERKWQLAIGALAAMAGGLAFAAQSTPLGWTVTGLVVTIGGNLTGYASHAYRAELFPTELRGRAIGLIYALDRLSAAVSSYLIGFVLVFGGVTAVLICIAGFSLVNMAVIAIWGPRTGDVGHGSAAGTLAIPIPAGSLE